MEFVVSLSGRVCFFGKIWIKKLSLNEKKNQKKQTKFHKVQIRITNKDAMVTYKCWKPAGNLYRYFDKSANMFI